MNNYAFDLDLDKRHSGHTVVMRQNDHDGTQLTCTLYDHGARFTTAGYEAYFVLKYPDGSGYYRVAATYNAGVVTASVDEEYACSVTGRTDIAYFELHQVNQNGTSQVTFSTANFMVIILPSGTAGTAEGYRYDDEIMALVNAWLNEHPEKVTTVQPNGIDEEKLADDSVSTRTIQNGAVIEDKIDGGAITRSKIAPNAVNTDKIAGGSVTDDKLDPSGILSDVSNLRNELDNLDVTVDVDDFSLEQDPDTGLVYVVYRGERGSDGIPLAGGGGGGGGAGNNAVLTVTNESGWLARTISTGATCNVTVSWSSIEDELPTGDGTMTITVGGVLRSTQTVSQGTVTLDIGTLLGNGNNKVKLRISDVYDNAKTVTFTVTCVELSLLSSFDTSSAFVAGQAVEYTYIPKGALEKTVHFVVDGTELSTDTVTVSGRQQSKTIPAMTHGAHSLRVYFTATVDSQTVYSNELYYELVVVNPSSSTPIIASNFRKSTATQYEMLSIQYTAYTPNSITSAVQLVANGTVVNEISVGRTEQTWAYRCTGVGSLTLAIKTGSVTKSFSITVSESEIDVHPETQALALYLSSYGRSNSEANPEEWEDEDNNVSATLSDFNFVSDGWVLDNDGNTVLRVANDARVTIPYQPFASDFRSTGKTLEFEFSTHDVYDYDATVISCWANSRGFKLTAQQAMLSSEQSTLSTQYKEDEHVRVSFVAEKRSEHRLLYIYTNGIMSGVICYPDNDNFQQANPVDITIGSNSCATDIYNIRIYDNDLTRYQILDNWIADTQDAELMLERYRHNSVYDEYGNVVIENLPTDLPYLVITGDLPTYKGDKKTVGGYYVDPTNPSKSFTFSGATIDVQGTSSQFYPRKNFKVKYSQGFVMTQGGATQSTFAMNADAIPTKTFTYKADVASSEGANNVELVRLYNAACPYKTPPQEENAKVRQGIDGFPIVIFHDTGDAIEFVGKYNWNNDKGTPEVFGFASGDESWEIKNNNSTRTVFKSADFSGSDWLNDFEARYPDTDPAYTDSTELAALASWIVSTDQSQATGNALSTSYTDIDGTTHTVDNAAYRLAKFKTEAPDHFEMSSAIFYYLFTELFLMIDSRAKNAFPSFLGGDKWCWLPYDFDSAIGINNEGALVFSYNLEDTDQVDGNNVFNGQDSVMWVNLSQAFQSDIQSMYQTLRSTGALSYSLVEEMFETHQSKWPEAVFNEDSWYKYIEPFVEDGTDYLEMAQGSKAEQRKWWLYNRFRYIDSKYNAGDAMTDYINLRVNAADSITVTPYADIYPTVVWESYTVRTRGHRGTASTLACPVSGTVTDMNVHIHSASQLSSVGDLSGLLPSLAEFGSATKLHAIKVGDSDSEYENPYLRTLTVGNNKLLGTVDARNCTNLATPIDLSGAANIEYVYLTGTQVTGVSLPNGGILKTLSLPDTITNLTVLNQAAMTSFSVEGDDYSGITTLRVENCSSVIPIADIIADMADSSETNQRVRVLGFSITASTTQDVEDFFDALDTMGGLDENGNNLANAVAAGSITGLGSITGSWLAEMNERYPNVTIGYEHITSTLTYKSYDGSTTLYTETVSDGGNGTYSGTPSRTSTAQYSYTFVGWSRQQDQSSADSTATQGVSADRTVYAAYTATVRTYTVTWKNADNTTLETDQNVPYGTTPTYNGSTPTYQGETSSGWSPSVGPITGDTTYTATYVPTYQVRFYSGTSSSSPGTLLQTTNVTEGSTPVYTGSAPTPPESYYEFAGWDKALGPIYAATDYYAKYHDTRSLVLQYALGTIAEVSGSTIDTVRGYAFAQCSSLTLVSLPSCTSVGVGAFYYCSKLTSVSLPACTSVGALAFCGCLFLTSISLPSCTSLANEAFYGCTFLTSIDLPSCTTIGNSAFYSCRYLTSISLPSCTSVGSGAFFGGCYSLTSVRLPACTYLGGNAFRSCSSLTSIDLPSCTSVGSSAFYGCSSLTSVNLPACTSLGGSAFYQCYSLTSIDLPSCTSVGTGTFNNCSKLTSVSLPSCTAVGVSAFYCCSSLTSINLPSCTYINNNAFNYCTNLTSIDLPICTYVGGSAFYQCYSLTSIDLPVCKSVSSSAFCQCSSLTSVNLPICSSFGNYAFAYCYNLVSLYLTSVSAVPTLVGSAFWSTPIDGYSESAGQYGSVYVPASLYSSFLTATKWSDIAARIVSVA